MTLTENQKEMIGQFLPMTKTKEDIEELVSRMKGNAYYSRETEDTYRELATMKLKLRRFK